MFAGSLTLFYDLFYGLERSGMLNRNDGIHLWCLHYTFLPVINVHLTNWKNAWIHHPLRTERNSTPMQLWIRGPHSIWGSQWTIDREVFQVNVLDFLCFSLDLIIGLLTPTHNASVNDAIELFVSAVEHVHKVLNPWHST